MEQVKNWQQAGITFIRIITGSMMAYHGFEVFDAKTMATYQDWDVIKNLPSPVFMMYLAKSAEFITGILLAVGFVTRFAAITMALIMFFICFKVGGGKFWYEDQHPFLFGLIALQYFFIGGGKWSVDAWVWGRVGSR